MTSGLAFSRLPKLVVVMVAVAQVVATGVGMPQNAPTVLRLLLGPLAAPQGVTTPAAGPTGAGQTGAVATTVAPASTVVLRPAVAEQATPSAISRRAAAEASVSAGRFEEAIPALEALKAADPTMSGLDDALVKAYVGLGHHLRERGEFDASWGQYEAALRVRPGEPSADDGKQQIILQKNWQRMEAAWGKDHAAVIAALDDVLLVDPGYRDAKQKLYAALVARADELLGAGEREQAIMLLRRALGLVPEPGEAQARLDRLTATPTTLPTPVPPPTAAPARPAQPKPVQPQPAPAPQPEPQPERPVRLPGRPV